MVSLNLQRASGQLLVKKKNKSLRICVDYRRLNSVVQIYAYPMPGLLDHLGKANFISTMDLTQGYWQVPVAEQDRHKTAFNSPFGFFQFGVMPFRLQGALQPFKE